MLTVTYIEPVSAPALSAPVLLGVVALLALVGLFQIARWRGLSGRVGCSPHL